MKKLISLISVLIFIVFALAPKAYAATSPTLGESGAYSVLGSSTVTNTGSSTTNASVGVSPGTAITGFPPGTAGGGTHSNDASAIAAQADNLVVFGALNQTCDHSYGAQDLGLLSPLGPGVYCSTSAFSIDEPLTLTGTGSGVYIFKSVSTLDNNSTVTLATGDPCKVWWRVGSSATLETSSTMLGSIFALTSVTMKTSATLNGRALVQTGAVTMDTNTITTSCLSNTSFPGITPAAATAATDNAAAPCIASPITNVPLILQSNRVSPTSVSLSWGPYAGLNTFIVRYGLANGNYPWSTRVTGFSTTLNSLPANQPIWVPGGGHQQLCDRNIQ